MYCSATVRYCVIPYRNLVVQRLPVMVNCDTSRTAGNNRKESQENGEVRRTIWQLGGKNQQRRICTALCINESAVRRVRGSAHKLCALPLKKKYFKYSCTSVLCTERGLYTAVQYHVMSLNLSLEQKLQLYYSYC